MVMWRGIGNTTTLLFPLNGLKLFGELWNVVLEENGEDNKQVLERIRRQEDTS